MAQADGGGQPGQVALHHGGGGLFHPGDVSGHIEAGHVGHEILVPDGHMAPQLGDVAHLAPRLEQEFRQRGEAHGKTEHIAGEVSLRAGDRLPALVQPPGG